MKALVIALGLAALPASGADIGGVWRLQGHVADVDIDRICTIKQANDRIQGTCKNQTGETLLNGQVSAQNVTWKYEAKYQGATVVLVFKGVLQSDAEVKGSITASDTAGNNMTTGSFTARRDDGWKLVWSDEFDRDGRPDPAKWTYETGFVRNQELQWYQPENAWCEKGLLIIEGRRERNKIPGLEAGNSNWKNSREYAEYTSASLTTKGIASWRYGRFEMRGRIDIRPGLWPAFWSLGADGRWPNNGEVDIMEYYRGTLLANLIWAGQGRTASFARRKPVASFADPQWAAKFHVWRMDWDENRIVISVDGEVLNDSDLNQAANPDGKNGFRQAHLIILNLAIGGTAGGDPAATEFPSRLEVDYVRIYQRQ